MSPPVVFLNPKSPVNVTKSKIVALKPLAVTAVTPLATLIGAETAPMATVVFTSVPVLL